VLTNAGRGNMPAFDSKAGKTAKLRLRLPGRRWKIN